MASPDAGKSMSKSSIKTGERKSHPIDHVKWMFEIQQVAFAYQLTAAG
jgi:hypothetical protein